MNTPEIITELKKYANPKNVEGMVRFGIASNGTLGISIPILRKMAKNIGKDHNLALELWQSDIHEAKILASYIESADNLSESQMESWVKDFDSWDVCDQVCDLFGRSQFALQKIDEWSKSDQEFVKRAAFALMAEISVHDKGASDEVFANFLPIIARESSDERNFVKKAVNWALRNIGKRNQFLNTKALEIAREIRKIDTPSARWIASDAIRELEKRKFD
ncbi:MAG: DNA alkylation repair protein [bacterium]